MGMINDKSEYEWVKWVAFFAEVSEEANSDMKVRMNLLKRAARRRLDILIQKRLKEVSDESSDLVSSH